VAELSHPRALVVIGASAGGQDPLCQLLSGLPPDLDAAVLVVVHRSAPNALPRVLSRCSSLPVRFAQDGDGLVAGRVLVAVPDRHLAVTHGRVRVGFGPRENGVRPAVDVLFRSAARFYGADVVAVVLSGNLNDGTAGFRAVNQAGGLTIVQDPTEATFVGMPSSAVELGHPAYILPAAAIAGHVRTFVADPSRCGGASARPAEGDGTSEVRGARDVFNCPDCGGPLVERSERGLPRYVCRVGHVFSVESLLQRQGSTLEEALWGSVVALEQRADLQGRMALRMEQMSSARASWFRADAERNMERAELIRTLIMEGQKDPGASPASHRSDAEDGQPAA